MQDLYQMLTEKEIAIERLRREIQVLRLVCNSLYDESDFRLSGETENALARIRGPLVGTQPRDIKKGDGRSVLLRFRKVGLDASRMFLRRVLDSPLLEHEPQRKSIRDLYERLGRFRAA